MVISCVCAFVCLCIHALKGKRLELSTPKLVHLYSMAASNLAKKIKSKVEGQGHKVIFKITVARLLVKCVAADVVGLHVDMTA